MRDFEGNGLIETCALKVPLLDREGVVSPANPWHLRAQPVRLDACPSERIKRNVVALPHDAGTPLPPVTSEQNPDFIGVHHL
jgi:hypothetical protein